MKEEAAEILRRIEICFPNVISALPRVWTLFENIKSFKDVEHYLLKNVGLCPNTYRCYLTAIKQAWEILEGLNPLQWQPIDINMVYEELIKRGDRNTVCLRIRGLKKFCDVISRNVPGYISPFEIMDEKLIKKLNIAKKTKKPGKQLSNKEFLSLGVLYQAVWQRTKT